MKQASSRVHHPRVSFTLFTTCTNPIIHLFYPQKICIGIVLDFSWDFFMSQEKLQTVVLQKFWGIIEVYYGIVQAVNSPSASEKCPYL